MKCDDPEFLEAVRLVRKFFPEAKQFITDETGLHWEDLVNAMALTGLKKDPSCDPYSRAAIPDVNLRDEGGFEGTEEEIYDRLLKHSGYTPSGRVVVVPDTIGNGASIEERRPFVCHSRTLPERLREFDATITFRYVYKGSSDTVLVFESREAFVVNHDNWFFWAKSKMRRWLPKSTEE